MSSWSPDQYEKFKAERQAAYEQLLSLIQVGENAAVLDLGCGTGELTARLHEKLRAGKTVGVDKAASMLAKSGEFASDAVSFVEADINSYHPEEKYDLVFSHCALQWLPGHTRLFERLKELLKKGGQLAVVMPVNYDYPTHTIARELANSAPFKEESGGGLEPNVLRPDEYAQILHQLGFQKQLVRVEVFGHELESTESLVEWVKGSLMTHYQERLTPEMYERFIHDYRRKLLQHFGQISPFYFPFKRLILWAESPR